LAVKRGFLQKQALAFFPDFSHLTGNSIVMSSGKIIKRSGRLSFDRVRLEDIAQQCDLSISTVSRVINKRTDQFPIAAKTIERVYAVAKKLGYRPNRLARAIAYQKTNLIGLSVPHHRTGATQPVFGDEAYFTAQIFGILAGGILDNPKMLDYDLVIHDRRKYGHPDRMADAFQNDLLDGIIYTNPTTNSIPFLREFAQQTPVILLGFSKELSRKLLSVDIDNRHAAKMCVQHVLQTGKRKPLILLPEKLRNFLCIQDRLHGYLDGLREAGLPASPSQVITLNQDPSDVAAWVRQSDLLRQHDAILVPTDELAIYCLKPLRERGFHIPRDIAVVGFSDSQQCQNSVPPLTTVRMPFHEMGYSAADLLIDVLNGTEKYSPGHHSVETSLCIRESTVDRMV